MGRSTSVFNKRSRDRIARSKKTLGHTIKHVSETRVTTPQAHAMVQANPNAPKNRPPMDRGNDDESIIERVGRFATNVGVGAEGTVRSYTTDIIDTAGSLITGSDSEVMKRKIQDMTLVDAYVTSAIAGNLDPAFAETKRRALNEPGRIVGEIGTEAATLVGTMGIGAIVKGAKATAFTSKALASANTSVNVSKRLGLMGRSTVETRVFLPADNLMAVTKTVVGKTGKKTVIKKPGIMDKAEIMGNKIGRKAAGWEPLAKYAPKIGDRTRGFYGVASLDETKKGWNPALQKVSNLDDYVEASNVIDTAGVARYIAKGVPYFDEPLSENIIDVGWKADGIGVQSSTDSLIRVNPKVVSDSVSKGYTNTGSLRRPKSATLTAGVDITKRDAEGYAERLAYALGETSGISSDRIKNVGYNEKTKKTIWEVTNPRGTKTKKVEAKNDYDAARIVAKEDNSYIASTHVINPNAPSQIKPWLGVDNWAGLKSLDDDVLVTKAALNQMKSATISSRIKEFAKFPSTIKQAKKEGITPLALAERKVMVEKAVSDGQQIGGGGSNELNDFIRMQYTRKFFSTSSKFARGLPENMRFADKSKTTRVDTPSGLMGDGAGETGYQGSKDAARGDYYIDKFSKNPRNTYKKKEVNQWKQVRTALLETVNPETGKLFTNKEIPKSFPINPNTKANTLRADEAAKVFFANRKTLADGNRMRTVTDGEKKVALEIFNMVSVRDRSNKAKYHLLKREKESGMKLELSISEPEFSSQGTYVGRPRTFLGGISKKLSWKQRTINRQRSSETKKMTTKISTDIYSAVQKRQSTLNDELAKRTADSKRLGRKESKGTHFFNTINEYDGPLDLNYIPTKQEIPGIVKKAVKEAMAEKVVKKKGLPWIDTDVVKKVDETIQYPKPNARDIDEIADSGIAFADVDDLLVRNSRQVKPNAKPDWFKPEATSMYDDYVRPSITRKVQEGKKLSKEQRDTSTELGKSYMNLNKNVATDNRGRFGLGMDAFGSLLVKTPYAGYVGANTFRQGRNAKSNKPQSKPNPEVKGPNYMNQYLSKGSGSNIATDITYTNLPRKPSPSHQISTVLHITRNRGILHWKPKSKSLAQRPDTKTIGIRKDIDAVSLRWNIPTRPTGRRGKTPKTKDPPPFFLGDNMPRWG